MNEGHDVAVQGVMPLGGVKFDIKTILIRLLPTLVSIITELVTTGKIDVSKKDSSVIQGIIALLHMVLDELEG